MSNHPNIPHHHPDANVHSADEFMALDRRVEKLIVDDRVCNDESFTELDLASFVKMKVFKVGNRSFEFVRRLKLIGLKKLEKVLIGRQSFSERISGENYFLSCFELKNCKKVKELVIDSYSFHFFASCEIENNDCLEVIQVGNMDEDGWNFLSGSLTLKSASDGMQ